MLPHHVTAVAILAMRTVLKMSAIRAASFLTTNAMHVLRGISTFLRKVSSVLPVAWAHIPLSTHHYRLTIAGSVQQIPSR